MLENIVLLDGAVGTSLWEKSSDKLPVWRYNIENPSIVSELCGEYIKAGSQIILANTFGANAPAVKRSSDYSVETVVGEGVRIARAAAEGTGVRVALSVGPLSALLEPYGDLSEQECAEIYREQLGAGMKQHPDLICLQTFIDLNMMTVAAREAVKLGVPVFCTMSFEKVGKTMMGQSVKETVETLTPLGIEAIGMNCSLGPDIAVGIIREFTQYTDMPLVFKPNAGKPILAADGTTATAFDADEFVKDVEPALDFVSYIGGCCGSNPTYIKKLKECIDKRKSELK